MKTLQGKFNTLVVILTVVMSTIVATNKCNAASTYTVNVPAGVSVIANNLNHIGGNDLNILFSSSTTVPPLPNFSSIRIWDCANGVFHVYTKVSGNWPAGVTLNPGEGAFLNRFGSGNSVVTFTGTLPPPAVAKLIPPGGCCFLSSQVCPNPTASFFDVAGFLPSECNVLAKYKGGPDPFHITPASYTMYTYYVNGGWFPSTPTVAPGETVGICNYNNCHSYNLDCVMSYSLAPNHSANAGSFVKADGFGNVYVGATKEVVPNGESEVVLLKYDCHCNMVAGWPQTFHVLNGIDELIGMDVDRGGSLYITCASSASTRGARTTKYDPAGNIVWGNPEPPFSNPGAPPATMGSVAVGSLRPAGIALDSLGRVLVAGTVIPTPLNPSRIAAVRYNGATGLLEPANSGTSIAPVDLSSLGDRATAMILDGANRVLVAGTYQQSGGLGSGCLTVRFRVDWSFAPSTHRVAGTATRSLTGVAIAWDRVNGGQPGWIHTLTSDSISGVGDRWMIRSYQDVLGLPPVAVWTGGPPIPGAPPSGEFRYDIGSPIYPTAIAVDGVGNVIATGRDSAHWSTVKFETPVIAPPTVTWSTTSPAIGIAPSALQLDNFGNAYVTGGATGPSPSDYLTVRYNGFNGVEDWSPVATFDFTGYNDTATDLDLDAADNVYVTGQSRAASGDVINTLKNSQGPPLNDTYAAAQVLPSCNPGTVAFNNRFATDTYNSGGSCVADYKDVWYSWVAPCDGTVDIDTCGSCFDTVMEVYDAGIGGTSCCTAIACNDDTGPTDGRCPNGIQSYVQFTAMLGHTYFFQIGGKTPSDFGDGRLTLIGPNPTPGTCPNGTFPPPAADNGWRVFRLTGLADGQDWRWSINIPCCANIEGIANVSGSVPHVNAGGSTFQLAKVFADSLNNSVCLGAIVAQVVDPALPAGPKRLRIKVKQCTGGTATCNNNSFVFRVGTSTTPYSQLCIVPKAVGTTISTIPSLSGICQFNPIIEEEYVPFEDCNGNGEPDDFEIAQGTSLDVNTNGIPDECEAGCTNGGQKYTVELQAGWNYLANQLLRPGGNTVSNVLPGVPDGSVVSKWNQNAGNFGPANNRIGGVWDIPSMTLEPGEGFVLDVPTAMPLTFAGCANPPHSLPLVTNGCALVANTTNATALYEDLFGQPPVNCTTLTSYEGTNAVIYTYFDGFGWSPSVPVLGVGEPALVCYSVPCLPVLAVQLSGTNVVLSWSDANFHLQATPAVSSSPVWTNVPAESPFTFPIGPSPLFFRLAMP